MRAVGFRPIAGGTSANFVVADENGRQVDVHLVDLQTTRIDGQGAEIYGPMGLEYQVGCLEGRGQVWGGRCLAAPPTFRSRHPRATRRMRTILGAGWRCTGAVGSCCLLRTRWMLVNPASLPPRRPAHKLHWGIASLASLACPATWGYNSPVASPGAGWRERGGLPRR
jgi:hypothetical protein